MRSTLLFSFVFIYFSCLAQEKNFVDSLKDSSISYCDRIEILSRQKTFAINSVIFFIRNVELETGIKSSMVFTMWGFTYLSNECFIEDIKKWKAKLKCKT